MHWLPSAFLNQKGNPGGFPLPKYMYIGRMKNGKTF